MDCSFHRHCIDLSEPGQIIAALPRLFGYYPLDSLVVLALGIEDEDSTCLALRTDLRLPDDDTDPAGSLAMPLAARDATGAVLIVVGGAQAGQGEPLPHRELLAHCQRRFAHFGLHLHHQLWASATTHGAPWRSYEHPHTTGTVPDTTPHTGHLLDRVRGYPRRENIAATLAPEDEQTLAMRADLIPPTRRWLPTHSPGRLRLIEQAIDQATQGILPETDHAITTLTLALADHAVRDACAWWPDSVRTDAAARVWTTLVRGAPTPHRAEPATLLAFAHYQRSDGVLTSIALDIAQAADPDHTLARLLRNTLNLALRPDYLQRAAHRARSTARQQIPGAQP